MLEAIETKNGSETENVIASEIASEITTEIASEIASEIAPEIAFEIASEIVSVIVTEIESTDDLDQVVLEHNYDFGVYTLADMPMPMAGTPVVDMLGQVCTFKHVINGANSESIEMTGEKICEPKIPFDVIGSGCMRTNFDAFYHGYDTSMTVYAANLAIIDVTCWWNAIAAYTDIIALICAVGIGNRTHYPVKKKNKVAQARRVASRLARLSVGCEHGGKVKKGSSGIEMHDAG